MNDIFLSYRRADEKGTTGRLFDHLVAAFGREAIFYDVDKIPHGADFREFIDRTMRNCKVALVVIGPLWLDMKDQNGRRLDQVNDPVRIEVEAALRYRKRVIPVLIDDAPMPDATTLPATIEQLAAQNAAPMHNNQYFEQDINTLLDDITRMGVTRKTQGPIINPPTAGLPTITARGAAAIGGISLLFIGLAVAAVIGIGVLGYNFVTGLINGGGATNGAHPVLTHFCAAMAANDVNTAFSDLSPAFQARIGSAAKLSGNLTTDFSGSPITVVGCHSFDQSVIDGFYHESGTTATDEVEFNALSATGQSETVGNKTMSFVKTNGVWKIDGVQND